MNKISLSFIHPDKDQPRQYFEPKGMALLEESIRTKGILNPLIVEKVGKDNYMLIDGERRYRTAVALKLKEVPAEIMEPMEPLERLSVRFHIQEQHQSWSPFDKARALYLFHQTQGVTMSELGRILNMTESNISSWMSILQLTKKTQEKVLEHRLPFTSIYSLRKLAGHYQKFTGLPLGEIEDKLFEKLNNHSVTGYKQLSKWCKIMSMEGDEKAKIKFLDNPAALLTDLTEKTESGLSVRINVLVANAAWIKNGLTKALKEKNAPELTESQEKSLAQLADVIARIIN